MEKKQKIIALIQRNRLTEARVQCNKLCNTNSHDPEAWFMLGGINAQLGAYSDVVNCCKRVIRLAPQHTGAHYNLAVALTFTGQQNEALSAYQAAIRINPGHGAAYAGMAALYRDLGDMDQAEVHFRHAIVLQPANSQLKNELVSLLASAGRFDEALKLSNTTCQAQPPLAEAHYNRAVILEHLGRPGEAADAYRAAIQLQADHVAACNNLGHILNELGQPERALPYFHKVIELSPDSCHGHSNIAVVLETIGRLAEAEQHYRTAIVNDGNAVDPRNHLGFLLTEGGRFHEALDVFEQLLTLFPGNETALAGKATVLEHMSRHEEAYQTLKPALKAEPVSGDVARAFSIVARHIGRHDEAIEVCNRALESPELPQKGITDLHFALGQLHDRLEHWDEAFSHYQTANSATPGIFDFKQHQNTISSIIKSCSADALNQLPRSSDNSERPIFIVGMPRSGTSLVEQILSSHPDVFGAGELTEISNIETSLRGEPGDTTGYPGNTRNLTRETCDRLAQRYQAVLTKISADTRFVTDKMPHNFLSLGLINLLFPNARIIHVRRNPLDTCISLYFQNFNALHAYSTNLTSLGQYYREYLRIMQHWRDTLDIRFTEVDYEDLVANQQQVTRELIEFCDLSWHERCLEFHSSSRFTKTPSYDQVRQPLYSHSVGRWKHYKNHISALIESLDGET